MKRLLSGIKATGKSHLGNYFGAMKQFVDMLNSNEYDCSIFVADYHSLNFIQDPNEMRTLTVNLVKDYIAVGLDPQRVTLFKQSDVSEHTELCWIFDTITMMPYLMRAHAYKDAEAKNKEIVVGTFNYPMLMAADILLYDPDVVPVGQDQKQHVEYARDTAEKFNRIFGDTFKLPEPVIKEDVAVVPGIDGRKMSKSYGNTIPLFATKDEIVKGVMSIVTDSAGEANAIFETVAIKPGHVVTIPRPANVYLIHKLFKSEAELAPLYEANKGKYKALKDALIEDIEALVAPMREKRASISDDDVKAVLADGASRAKAVASKKMEDVRKKVGVVL